MFDEATDSVVRPSAGEVGQVADGPMARAFSASSASRQLSPKLVFLLRYQGRQTVLLMGERSAEAS